MQVKIGKGNGLVTSVRLMMRRKGETDFTMVAQFTSRSIIDHTPLKTPGTPEDRANIN